MAENTMNAFDLAKLAGLVEYDPCDCCGSAGGCLCSSKMCSTCRFCETHCACVRARCNGCDCRLYLDQSLDGFDDRCTEGKGHKDSVAYAAIAQAHALCRIADALEKLAPEEFPKAVIEHMCRHTLETRRIADALEKLVPAFIGADTKPPGSHGELPNVLTSEELSALGRKKRCEICQGTGFTKLGETFCSCQTGKDLEAQQKRMGHLEA